MVIDMISRKRKNWNRYRNNDKIKDRLKQNVKQNKKEISVNNAKKNKMKDDTIEEFEGCSKKRQQENDRSHLNLLIDNI